MVSKEASAAPKAPPTHTLTTLPRPKRRPTITAGELAHLPLVVRTSHLLHRGLLLPPPPAPLSAQLTKPPLRPVKIEVATSELFPIVATQSHVLSRGGSSFNRGDVMMEVERLCEKEKGKGYEMIFSVGDVNQKRRLRTVTPDVEGEPNWNNLYLKWEMRTRGALDVDLLYEKLRKVEWESLHGPEGERYLALIPKEESQVEEDVFDSESQARNEVNRIWREDDEAYKGQFESIQKKHELDIEELDKKLMVLRTKLLWERVREQRRTFLARPACYPAWMNDHSSDSQEEEDRNCVLQ